MKVIIGTHHDIWWNQLSHSTKCDLLDKHSKARISWHDINPDLFDCILDSIIKNIWWTEHN